MCSAGSSKYWTPVNLTREGHVQYSTVAITTFCLVCFEAVARELDDVSHIPANALRFPLCPIMALIIVTTRNHLSQHLAKGIQTN